MTTDRPSRVLVFNPGSASLKFEVVASEPPVSGVVRGTKVLSGVVEPIGAGAKFSTINARKKTNQEAVSVKNHGDAAKEILARIDSGLAVPGGISSAQDIDLVGHRIVHGADQYVKATVVDDELVKGIEQLEELAPLHNVGAVSVIRASRAALGNAIPQIAVFDTSFHRSMPDRARLYAIPLELTQRHKIQRFGFHGISHHYLTLRYAELTGTPLERTNIITLHLEGGSSATAVVSGKSVDTSMGFTPLEGLMMGTRSGDIDPALVGFLARKEGMEVASVEELLNKKSGLLGVSGRSADTRELIPHQSEERVALALDMFAYRVRKYIGAYLAASGKMAAVVFSGGIGENTPEVRRRICEGLDRFGLDLDADRNTATVDCEGKITRDESHLHAFVIPTEEGLMIAHQALLARPVPKRSDQMSATVSPVQPTKTGEGRYGT